jgi:hypothetical protein
MKYFTFVATVIVCVLLFSCSNDESNIMSNSSFTMQRDSDSLFDKDGDTLIGEPVVPPKGKD